MSILPASREEVRDRIIVALDVPTLEDARRLVDELAGSVGVFKIGLELLMAGGSALAAELASEGHAVFVDAKLHDIPETVARAARSVARIGARFVTVHGPLAAVRAAAAGGLGATQMLGVTVLTSMEEDDVRREWGMAADDSLEGLVLRRARLLLEAGCAGLITSTREVAALRERFPEAILVTPGIRPEGEAAGDQARVGTPRAAAEAGADYLVVGRPLRDAHDRRAAAESIADSAWAGFRARSA